jgi:hypothetical protein
LDLEGGTEFELFLVEGEFEFVLDSLHVGDGLVEFVFD